MRYIFSLLLFLVSMCAMSQSDIKDLKKKAKKGDVVAQRLTGIGYLEGYKVDNKKAFKWLSLAAEGGDAEAMYRLGNMYEDGKVKDGNSEMAWSWYVKAANVGNVACQMKLAYNLKEQEKLSEAKDWFFRAAIQANADAQYEYGMFLLSDNNESEAKSWFKKAADKNHVLAKIKYDAILRHEREVAEAKAKRLALEAAQRDSIARIEAEQQRVKDSIDYATGKKLKPYQMLASDCNLFVIPAKEYEQESYLYKSDFYKKLKAVISNDVFAYFGKEGLDELDREVYKKSSQYQDDLAELKKKRKEKYALLLNIYNSASNVDYSADGLTFSGWGHWEFTEFGINNFFICFSNILFPIKNARVGNNKLKLRSSNLNLLQRIKAQNQNLSILLIFTPSSSVEYERDESYYLTLPLGLYLVDNATGETLADFSNAVRKSTFQADKQRILTGVKKYNARIKANAPKYHKQAKEITCIFCGGKGYTEYFPVGSATLTRSRCTNCYGRGYTIEHYY